MKSYTSISYLTAVQSIAVLITIFLAIDIGNTATGYKLKHISGKLDHHTKPRSLALNAKIIESVESRPVKGLFEGMHYRQLPGSELVISEVGLGSMNFGDQLDVYESHALLDAAVDKYAINFIDTAESYPFPSTPSTAGSSQQIIGQWLKKRGKKFRKQVVLSTCISGWSDEYTWCRGADSLSAAAGTRLTAAQIVEAVDKQLELLGTDYIDLLQFHWPHRYVPLFGSEFNWEMDKQRSGDVVAVLEQLRAVQQLVDAGKVRSFGLSNETPYGVTDFVRTAELMAASGVEQLPRACSVQNVLNLLDRNSFESGGGGMMEAVRKECANVGFIAYSPLAGGALSGKYKNKLQAPRNARMRKYLGYMYRYVADPAMAAVRDYAEIADAFSLPLSVLSLGWVYSHPAVTSTLVGATSLSQLEQNVLALNMSPMEKELLHLIDDCYKKHLDPARGSFEVFDPDWKYVDPSKLPWGARDEDIDPQLDAFITKRMQKKK